jgi:hypothetical protein
LEYGEIAVNYEASDPCIYIKDSANTIRRIGDQPGALVFQGSVAPTSVAPTSPRKGDVYVMSAAGVMAASWTGMAGKTVVQNENIVWDGTEWETLGSASIPSASETAKGIVELATAAETTTGTDATRAVHPAGLKSALTFTQDGTDAKPRTYLSKLKDVVSVKDFGAVGDGATECAAAIQAAINTGKDVFIPSGVYKVSTPINVTNRAAGAQKIFGESWGISQNGSVIRGNTGGAVFDCTGSQFLSFEDFGIDSVYNSPPFLGTIDNPSKIGFLFARSTTSQYAQFNTLRNIFIKMPLEATAYGGKGTVGIYNNAAEIHHYDNIYVTAGTPLVINGYNAWGVTSSYQTIDTSIPSMSMISVTGSSTLTSNQAGSQACYIANAFGVDLRNCYFTGLGAATVKILGSTSVTIDGHIEGQDRMDWIEDSQQLTLRFTGGNVTNSPIYTGPNYTAIFDLKLRVSKIEPAWPYIVEATNISSVLKQVDFSAAGDDGSKVFTNINNVSGIHRVVSTGLATGGPLNPQFVGTTTPLGLLDLSTPASGQIRFPATQNASTNANTLDDYEEGSWTPGVAGTTSGTAAGYYFKVGRYTKVGNIVHVQGTISINGIGSMVGNFKITGLPFAAGGNFPEAFAISVGQVKTTVPAGSRVSGVISQGSTEVSLQAELNGTSSPLAVAGALDLYFSATYPATA